MSDDRHLDPNVPGNPAYHFTIVPPGAPSKVGWAQRAELVPGARLGTQCVHAGVQPDPAYGAVIPPIYQTSTFAFREVCTNAGYDYTRSGNPTRAALEEALTLLEGGSGATCTSTGMSAVMVALNLLPANSHLVCTVDCYGGTFRALEHAKKAAGLEVTYVDLAQLEAVRRALRDDTRMVWIETPSNPLLRITDIASVSGPGQGTRRPHRRRQHLPLAGAAEALRSRGGPGGALHHQVLERAQRRRRRGGGGGARTHRAVPAHSEYE